jgi:MATE family multidrug resistance protein
MRLARAEGRLVRELKTIIELALPMMLAQGGLMAMGVVDTLMVGRVSSLEMSAVALGGSIAGVIVVFGIGLAMGIEPLVSQANGAGDPARGRAWMWQGLYLCALISIPLAILTAVSTLLLEPLGIPRDIAERSNMYVWGRMPGILANCLYAVLRSYLSALGRPRPVLFAVLAANVLNVFLDWILIFGLLGLPALGGTGAGIATSIAWTFMTIVLAVAIARMPVPGTPSQAPISRRMRYEDMATISRIGWPIGMQIAAEVGIFALVSALIARFGDVQLAGHQIAITVASLSFMAAVGIANATTARVGHWIGAEDSPMARRAGFVGIVLGGSFMAACGLSYLIFREPLATLFAPNDPAAAAVGADLLVIAAAFAIFDGIQAVSAGALRGAGDTRWTFYANAIGHWLIALPMAIYLGHERGLGTVGYWWALTAGLIGAAAILTARFVVISKKQMARVEA